MQMWNHRSRNAKSIILSCIISPKSIILFCIVSKSIILSLCNEQCYIKRYVNYKTSQLSVIRYVNYKTSTVSNTPYLYFTALLLKQWYAFSFAKVSLKRTSLYKPIITSVTMTVSHERNCSSNNAINLRIDDKVDKIRIVRLTQAWTRKKCIARRVNEHDSRMRSKVNVRVKLCQSRSPFRENENVRITWKRILLIVKFRYFSFELFRVLESVNIQSFDPPKIRKIRIYLVVSFRKLSFL